MSQLGYFDSNAVEPSSSRDAIPLGKYRMAVTASEVKTTKAGTGKYIAFEWTVLEGEFKGRKVWQNVNFQNPSVKAQQIGQGELSAICRACAKPSIRDTAELHNIPVFVKVGVEKDMNGNDRNNVKEVLWKETTKPNLGGIGGGGNSGPAPAVLDDNDPLPF
jgi:hypothetical protein